GHGMDQDTLKHLFEPFYTTKEVGRGTGLGLAVVYGIVEQHGGFINCESETGRGTRFEIYLPAMGIEREKDSEENAAMPAFGTETILLVDDEEFVRDLADRILSKAGYTVLTAANGCDALQVYNTGKDKISLVILDLIMPEMGGKQCLEELMKIDPKPKILVASGYTGEESPSAAVDGACGFIRKPFKVKELLRDVRKVLDSQ
ncbi:MAG: response regulator, partial [Desulfomonile tiedjei]|nr:response regulator [Desulfomonile tiedjei]